MTPLENHHWQESQNVYRPRSQEAEPALAGGEDYQTQGQQRREQAADGISVGQQHQGRSKPTHINPRPPGFRGRAPYA